MSLPKGMKWDNDSKTEGKRTRYSLRVVNRTWLDLEDYEFGDIPSVPFNGTLAHAELIIRAIEAPETLEVKDEST